MSDNFRRRIKSKIYLGPDVRGLSSPGEVRIDTGLNVPFHEIGDEYGIWYYDNNAEVESGQKETWRIIEHVNTANIGRSELESKAFSLQSRILSDHLVGMYAVRNDKQTVYQRLQETVNYGDPSIPGVRPLRIDLPGIHEIDGNFNEGLLFLEDTPASTAEDDTTTWSIVGKYPEVLLGDLPFGMDITAHYYEAESFQPAGISNNVLNQPLASPFGETEEYGVTIELFDRRLSIRYNEYTTANSNSRTGNFNGHLGNITGWFNARFLDRITSSDNTGAPLFPNVTDALLTPDTIPNNSARKSGTDADLGGFTSYQEYYDAIIAAIVPRAQEARNVRVETLENGDRVDLIDPIRGLNSTQDFVSEGKEIDIIGQLTDNLSISLNVAQQETVTTNTAPVAIPLAFEQAELLQRPLPNSPGGWSLWDLRDEAFQGTLTTIGDTYARTVREMRVAQGKDGTVSQEQREWRVNLAMRYDFLEGAFKGLQVGGNLRYQDEVAAGYPNKFDEFGNALPDIENPFFGPSELNGDLFIRYGRSLTDKIDWKIQLNMRNLYRDRGSKDIPVTYNPDGQVAIIRIPNEQQFLLTNTVSF